MGHPALEIAGRWVELGLSVETKISGRASLIDIMWGWEVSGGPVLPPRRLRPNNQLEHQDPASHMAQKKSKRENKNKNRNKNKKTNRQNPRTNGKSKPIQTKSHKEAYT